MMVTMPIVGDGDNAHDEDADDGRLLSHGWRPLRSGEQA